MDDTLRVDMLESEFVDMQKLVTNHGDTLRQIQQQLSLLIPEKILNPQNNPATPVTSAPAIPTPPSAMLKPATPNEFDGARDKGRAFLNSCKLYMSLAPQQFADDQACIGWTLSYMKSGRASLFANRVL